MKNIENCGKVYVTKKEFCNLCGISPSTAYKMIKNKKIKFIEKRDRLLRYYDIPYSEVELYIAQKEQRKSVSKPQQEAIRLYYETKTEGYPDCISAKDIILITGYAKETIRRWINSGKIVGAVTRKRFVVAKEDLIDFLCTPYYSNIIRKSKEHIADSKKYTLSRECVS